NRKSECMLHEAEFLSSLALINGGKYDQKALYEAWKTVMTNQFHDILPGSSITEVYAQTAIDYAEAQAIIRGACEKAVTHLARKIDTTGEGTPVVVFNSLSWVRDDMVKASVKLPKGRFSVLDTAGNPVPCQKVGKDTVVFEANGVPPLGYAVYRVVSGAQAVDGGTLKASDKGMENDSLRIKFDKNGCLSSVFDKAERREVLPKGQRANVLQLFDDRPRANDAWDIDFNFEEHMWEPDGVERIEVIESGPVRAVVRIVRKTEKSTISQDVTLYANSPRIDFVTTVDWWEKRTLLKAAFPVDVRTSRATYEIQFATIERATHSNTDFDQARFEVPAQRWADLSEGDYGVSLLNDCKYGYDVKENVLRLSLLRSPVEPDATADEGRREMTYSLYPHAWGWRNGTVQQAAELNHPMLAVAAKNSSGELPAVSAFADVDADNVVIDTVKRHEDSNALIVRLYEAFGQRGNATVTFGRDVESITECDLMEENDVPVKVKGNSVTLYMTPYEIRTLKVTVK
ncbi:MAG: alpha-mannosidase, partial [bacterium]|nr:alpha-mannosidase [bacterium]